MSVLASIIASFSRSFSRLKYRTSNDRFETVPPRLLEVTVPRGKLIILFIYFFVILDILYENSKINHCCYIIFIVNGNNKTFTYQLSVKAEESFEFLLDDSIRTQQYGTETRPTSPYFSLGTFLTSSMDPIERASVGGKSFTISQQ